MIDHDKIMAKMMADREVQVARAKEGLYGGIAFTMTTSYEFMVVVNTCKLLGKEKVYWLDNRHGSPVEVPIDEAFKICGALMRSYGRSLAGDHTLVRLHLQAYEDSEKDGAPAKNLTPSVITPLTDEQIAAAKVACNAPSS